MLSSVLALITCATIPVNDPLEISAQMPPGQPAVEVGTYTTSSSFRCRNFSSTNYILVFGLSGQTQTALVPLPPGASVEYAITPELVRDVSFEVVAVDSPTDLETSGAIALALPATSTDGSLWFVPGAAGLVTWEQHGCDVERVVPSDSILPANILATDPGEDSAAAAAQTPTGVPTGSSSTAHPPQSLPPM
jgi:hypothetical protein